MYNTATWRCRREVVFFATNCEAIESKAMTFFNPVTVGWLSRPKAIPKVYITKTSFHFAALMSTKCNATRPTTWRRGRAIALCYKNEVTTQIGDGSLWRQLIVLHQLDTCADHTCARLSLGHRPCGEGFYDVGLYYTNGQGS